MELDKMPFALMKLSDGDSMDSEIFKGDFTIFDCLVLHGCPQPTPPEGQDPRVMALIFGVADS